MLAILLTFMWLELAAVADRVAAWVTTAMAAFELQHCGYKIVLFK